MRRRFVRGGERRWVVLPKKSDDLVEQLLLNRGIDPADTLRFFEPDFGRDLHDPLTMKNMEAAVDRLSRAIRDRETIAIFGDYDVDGTPAAALLHDFLTNIGHRGILHYIPTREEGYGLNRDAIDTFKRQGASLLVTVDTGVRNIKEVAYAKSLGIDTIVCDHHLLSRELPEAIVLNPKQPGDRYPFKELCGAGVAFKLLQATVRVSPAISHRLRDELDKFLKWETDLVALSTIVDMVPLVGENRVLATFGLIALRKTRRIGLQKLYTVAGIDPAAIDSYTASFLIGPRLNAASRMDHATQSFYLLTTTDEAEAERLARDLNDLNRQRQKLLERVLNEARAKVEQGKLYEKKVIVVDGEQWPHGIIGLVAGKLVEEYARPAIVFERGKIRSKGSARSVDAFHLVEALDHCQEVLLKYGGHAKAAGLTLETKHLATLYDKLLEYAETHLADEDLVPTISADAELPLSAVTEEVLSLVERFEPHGIGNPRPLFLARDGLVQQVRAVGAEGQHLKMVVSGHEAIAFDLGELAHKIIPGDVIDLIYSLDRDKWNGRSRLQLRVIDVKRSGLE